MAEIRFDDVTKQFEDGTLAVDRLDLTIDDGEFMVLVGPSGCGKTTSLRMVAGLEDLTSGEIRIGDEVVNDLPAKRRDIAMVFQNYALYPHMSVAQNMGFGLRLRGVPRAARDHRVREAAAVLDLTELLDRRPRQLSGGQRQRVAMGRAIVREPRAFLMDEPLSNLDAKLRVQMRAEIARIQQRLGVTTLYVTHDQVEAMTMGDRVAVMRNGILQQVASPTTLYERPVNLFVAGFIGSPAMNLVEAVVRVADDSVQLEVGTQTIMLAPSFVRARPVVRRYHDQTVALGIRPEHLQDVAFTPGRRAHFAEGWNRRSCSFGDRRHATGRVGGLLRRLDRSNNLWLCLQRFPCIPRLAAGDRHGGFPRRGNQQTDLRAVHHWLGWLRAPDSRSGVEGARV